MFRRTIFSIILSLWVLFTSGQVNLVPNSSFETYTNCPYYSGQVNFTGNWYSPNTATPDYYNACAPQIPTSGIFCNVPKAQCGYQKAYNSGNAYVGIIAGQGLTPLAPTWAEYVQTQLTNSLVPGQRYYCSFYVSLANNSPRATDVISAYISQTAISSTVPGQLTFTPQLSSPPGFFLTDTLDWFQISGSFIAQGGERYITIGAFTNSNSSIIQLVPDSIDEYKAAYYYLDQVCLSLSWPLCKVFTTGIDEHRLPSSIFYFDQESKKLFFKEPSKNMLVTITDIMGKQVRSHRISENDEIDICGLDPGCYLVFLNSSEGKVVVKKIFLD